MDNGRQDTSLLAPSKSKGLSIGSDIISILCFLWIKSPCHTGHPNHWNRERERRARNYPMCFEVYRDLNLTPALSLETLLRRLASLVPFCIFWQGFQTNTRIKTTWMVLMFSSVMLWRNPGRSGCVVVDIVTGVQSACGLRIASLDWTCAMFSLLKLRTYVYLTGAMKSQSIAVSHITTFHAAIILTVRICLCLPFHFPAGRVWDFVKSERWSLSGETLLTFLPNPDARPERRCGCKFNLMWCPQIRAEVVVQRELKFKANKWHVVCAFMVLF